MIRFATFNLMNYDGQDPAQDARYGKLTRTIKHDIAPDILAVQELISSDTNGCMDDADKRLRAGAALCELADALGMTCIADGAPAVAISRTRHHTGLLWRNGISVVPGGFTPYDSATSGISHGMATAVFDLGGVKLRAGSAHLSPTDPGMSGGWLDAGQVHKAFHREDGIVGLVGGDWQGIGADVTFDPNPYIGVDWHPAIAYHYDTNGRVDRDAAYRLEANFRFKDCAVFAGARWKQTTGHHETDRQPARRIDRIYGTYDLPNDAVMSCRTLDPDEIGQCSDHCPVLVEVDETLLYA